MASKADIEMLYRSLVPFFPEGSSFEKVTVNYDHSHIQSFGFYENKPNGKATLRVEVDLPREIVIEKEKEDA